MDRDLTGGRKGTEWNGGIVQGGAQIQLPQGQPPQGQPLKPNREWKFTQSQGLFAWIMLLIGFFYIDWIGMSSPGLGVTLFALLFCGFAMYYMWMNGLKQTKVSAVYLAVTLASAIQFAVLDNGVTIGMNVLFLQCMAVYWICVTAGRRINGDLSAYVIGDFFNQMIMIPFGNFGREFAALFGGMGKKQDVTEEQRERKRGRRRNILLGAAGFFIILPVLILVINLLADADAVFADMISRISFHFALPDNMLFYVAEFLLGIPVACYLFGLINGNITGRGAASITSQSFDRAARAMGVIPRVTICTAVGAMIFVYVLFFATQAAYLFSAFRGSLPVTMTYAEYARRGFFELCTIAGINLVLIAAANLFAERVADRQKNEKGAADSALQTGRGQGTAGTGHLKGLRVETGALCVLTMMLIATAVSKMGMYIHYYGLTQLRFYTTAFMLLMFLSFAVILARQIRSFNSGRWLALICLAGFLTVTYSNADGLIARYNISRYETGTLESLDVDALACLSDAAVPPMLELYQTTEDEMLKRDLYLTLTGERSYEEVMGEEETDFREWNYQRARADRMLREMQWGGDMEDWFRDYQQSEEFLYEQR